MCGHLSHVVDCDLRTLLARSMFGAQRHIHGENAVQMPVDFSAAKRGAWLVLLGTISAKQDYMALEEIT